MAEIAKVNDIVWEDIAEVAGVAKASVAKIGASAEAPAGGVALLDNTKSARTYGCAAQCWARTPPGNYTGRSGPLWDLFERTNAWSIGAWVKHSSGTGYRFFCGKMEYLVSGFMCGVNTNALGNTPVLEIRDQNDNTIKGIGTTAIGDGDWHFVVYAYDGNSASSAIKIFVDGGADESTGSGVTLDASIKTPGSTFLNFVVGIGQTYTGGYADHWNGWIDELSIWDVALSESEAAECYTATTDKTPDLNATSQAESLVHWWRMGDGDFGGTDDTWSNLGWPSTQNNLVFDMSTSSGYDHNLGSFALPDHPSTLCCVNKSSATGQINLVSEVP